MAKTGIIAVGHGVKVPQSPHIDAEQADRIARDRYEGDEINAAIALARPGARVLELGAGIGLVGAAVALNRAPARVLSFEANPMLVDACRAMYRLNGLEDRIELRNAVLMAGPDRPDEVPFYLRAGFRSSSMIRPVRQAFQTVRVPTAGFDAVRDELRPDMLIADIEGAELDLLRHADLRGIRAAVIEFHPGRYGEDGFAECRAALARAGLHRVEALSTRRVWACVGDDG